MIVSSISDLHIKKKDDAACKLFLTFSCHEKVLKSDAIFLLGDIFDFMVGNYEQYPILFPDFFTQIVKFLNSGKKVYFIEGNHDFHIEEMLQMTISRLGGKLENFFYLKDFVILNVNNKNIMFTHGHEVDEKNESYKKWKKIYTSLKFKFLIEKILPFCLVLKLGAKASGDSKKRGRKTFNLEKYRDQYLDGARSILSNPKLDALVAGHTHISENISYNNKTYINNGFAPETKSFIYIDEMGYHLINLD